MSSERGGLLKTRAENFARHLQTRLRSLSDTEDGSWASEVSSSSDNEIYYDIDSSLASPEEEVTEPIFIAVQNHDSLSLSRSDSSGSQYFDTVESLDDQLPSSSVTSVPTLKKIPILHLKTDNPTTVTNGYTDLLDADSGCSRVHEMSSSELDQETGESDPAENKYGSNSVLENNNTWKEYEEVELDKAPNVELCSSGLALVEIDTRQSPNEATNETADDVSESTNNSFCVFCDIEQIKSTLSNKCSESGKSEEEEGEGEEVIVVQCTTNELDKEEKVNLQVPFSSDDISECSSENEETVSLTDLLQVLKQEMTKDNKQKQQDDSESKETENCSNSESVVCPAIEVRESSPEQAETKTEEDEIDDIETKRKHFRRCSSLKTGKTPPGTPGGKKIVRFADVLGLDLADVKTFLDEVPTIPKSAYEDLHGIDLSLPALESPSNVAAGSSTPHSQPSKILMPLFQQPSVQPNFLDRVRQKNVCLESAYVSDMSLFAISGLVRVKNIDFHKSVYVRYSINNWRSFSDLQARYVPNSCDGFSDKFSFILYAHTLNVGQRLEFAIRFHTAGEQFWDSNGGVNYVFECVRAPSRTYADPGVPPSPIETWASFY